MLELSFAQFQSDQAVVGLARQVQRNNEALEGYKESIDCHLGDFLEYAALRRRIGERESSGSKRRKLDRRVEAQESLEKLRIGDIIRIPAGRSAGWALVLDPGVRSEREGPRPTVLTLDRQVRKLSMIDFPTPVEAIGSLRVPKKFNPRNPQQRRELAHVLRGRTDMLGEEGPPSSRSRNGDVVTHADDPELQQMRAELRAHPVPRCARTARTTPAGPSGTSGWTGRTARCSARSSSGRTPSPGSSTGSARCWTRCTTSTATRPPRPATGCRGSTPSSTWSRPSACGRACSTTSTCRSWPPAWRRWSTSRASKDEPTSPRLPRGEVRTRWSRWAAIWRDLSALERDMRVDFLRPMDLGFCWAAYRWASGASLAEVLYESDLAAGDFVRWVKQLIDLTEQVADAAGPTPLRSHRPGRHRPDPPRRHLLRLRRRRALSRMSQPGRCRRPWLNRCSSNVPARRTPAPCRSKEFTSVELSRRNLGKLAVATGATAAVGLESAP